jgi:hypothetical protein
MLSKPYLGKPLTDSYSEKETVARRDAIIKKMLATPPKPHSEMKVGKKAKKKKRTKTPKS